MPPTLSKPRHSARLDREEIDKEFGLSFPLEDFKNSEVPRNHEVLERLFFILSNDSKGQIHLDEAAKLVVSDVVSHWRGSNILVAHEQTLVKRVTGLHSLYE